MAKATKKVEKEVEEAVETAVETVQCCPPNILEKAVLDKLGKPKDFAHVDLKKLWGSNYRVNVWCKVGKFGQQMTDSFFVVTSPDGIERSNPKIERKYQ